MIIGVPKEIKVQEYRVGVVPAGVQTLVSHGHRVLVETGAGLGSGNSDEEYVRWGAEIISTADEVWARADMIIKVKEPIGPEHARYRDGQILYTYFHMAAAPDLAPALLEKHVAAVAYETIELTDRS
ncbi:MAG: alanine dehydrogenase, partial [Deltaproteobacteria bacterium]|nr:alanine dehydrogenase [Deltaproteobacteria bacterium]